MCSVCNLSFHLTIWGKEPLWWRGPWELASTCWSDCLQRETCRSYHGSRVTVIKSWCCTVVLLEESLEVESERAPLIVKDEMQDRHQITATQLHAETWRCRIRFRRTLGNNDSDGTRTELDLLLPWQSRGLCRIMDSLRQRDKKSAVVGFLQGMWGSQPWSGKGEKHVLKVSFQLNKVHWYALHIRNIWMPFNFKIQPHNPSDNVLASISWGAAQWA